jgi:hypothetical protein
MAEHFYQRTEDVLFRAQFRADAVRRSACIGKQSTSGSSHGGPQPGTKPVMSVYAKLVDEMPVSAIRENRLYSIAGRSSLQHKITVA